MATVKLKNSSVAAKVPLTTDLSYGELALNYSDGKLYYKKSDGITIDYFGSAAAVPAAGVVSFNSRTGAVILTGSDVTSALGFTPYNSTNPGGYITSAGSISGNAATATNVAYSGLTGAIPTWNQNTTGTAANVTGVVALANGGTGATSAAAARTSLGAYAATNPNGYTTNTGTVASVSGTGTVSGLTLSGSVTSTGSLTLGGSLSLTSGNVTSALGFTPYNATNPSGYITGTSSISGNAATATNVAYSGLTGTVPTWNQNTTGNALTVTNGVYTSASYADPAWITSLSNSKVGLSNVDNTSDATKNAATATLTNKTVEKLILNNGYTEGVFAVTDGTTVNLDPNNGSIQTWTLGANRTPGQSNWASGQSITLLIDDGAAQTITWTALAVVWKTDGGVAPTLQTSGVTAIVLWKVGTAVYGARVGDA